MAHKYSLAVAFSSTSPMVRTVVGSVSTSIDVDVFADGPAGTIVTFSMMVLPSWVDTLVPRLGIRGKTIAPVMGAMGDSLAILADDGVVGHLGTAAPPPPLPARLREVEHSWLPPRHMLPEWCGYTMSQTQVAGHGAPAIAGPCQWYSGSKNCPNVWLL